MSRVGFPNITRKFSNSSLLCLRVSRSVELVLSGPSSPGVWGTGVAGSGGLVMKVSAWELDIWTPYNTSSIQEAGVLFGAGGVEMKSRGDVLLPMFGFIGRALEEDSSRFGKGLCLIVVNPFWASLRGRLPFREGDDPSLAIRRRLYCFTGGWGCIADWCHSCRAFPVNACIASSQRGGGAGVNFEQGTQISADLFKNLLVVELEVSRILDSGNSSCLIELNVIFVKKLITLAMDRKNREKEMASVLLSSVCFPADDVVNGFVMLIESADDAALDISIVVEDLAMFLARAKVDEVLTPQHMKKLTINFSSRIQWVLLFDDVPKKKRV
ncbi:hypothetical protein FXO38_28835 [Capsicum annuum]|uniref:MI domain-containing protein n=1 Tax=Capsicum annuum TaxID=4072 RepID=A0A2G2ZMX3_CAPAN|nr:hypothetical protein FXO38_28835 [Capsicum annuum]KAF3629120.1 hypothetical protein FXO37_29072 [Capsicum annuum]PHT83339.1 hypothetical protein T459_11782 [Capsicum annuum]